MSDCNFEEPRNLKDILEELGKLYNTTSTKKKVFQQLRDGLKAYCGASYLEAFYRDLGSGRGVSSYGGGTIQALTDAGKKISRQILQNPTWADSYSDPHVSHSGCAEKYFNAIKECLPELFSALLFLFFNCDSGCRNFGGGSWNSYKVNESGHNLYNWLIGDSDLITRGFLQGELHKSNNGKNVAEQLKNAVSLRPGSTEGSLQRVLCGFMFVCSWDDPLTGHACLFLSTFCSKVLEGSESFLQGKYKEHSEAFKDVCRGLKDSLEPFIGGSSGLSAVCHGNTNLFDNLWDDEKFSDYCTWLKGNLHSVIEALQTMSLEPPDWDLSSLQSGGNAGPFKYGFVFKDSWTSGSTSMSKLQDCISKLTGEDSGSLGKLKSFLENPSTPSSAGATAGGVFTGILGTGGLGAGAAYATNAFGLKDIITGLISGFLK